MTLSVALLLAMTALVAVIAFCQVAMLRRRDEGEKRAAAQLAMFVDVIERALKLEPGRISQDMAMIAVGNAPGKPKRPTAPPRDIERERREAIEFAARTGQQIPIYPPASMNRRPSGPLEEDALPLGGTR